MKLKLNILLIIVIVFITPQVSLAGNRIITIGIISIIEHPALNAVREGFISALAEKKIREGKEVKYLYNSARGQVDTANQIVAQYIGKNVDLILAIGTSVAKVAAEKTTIKPVIFAAVTDPLGANLVENLEYPGGNVTGTSDMNPVDNQLNLIKKLIPTAKRVGILYNNGESNSVAIVKLADKYSKKYKLEMIKASANRTADVHAAVASLVGKVDVVYMPTDNTMAAAIDIIITVCKDNKIPFFSSEDKSVEDGDALASICVNYLQLGYQTGNMAYKILKGTKPASIPVEYQKNFNLIINESVANKFNIKINKELYKKAKIIR